MKTLRTNLAVTTYRTPVLDAYLRDISKYNVMTFEEEQDAFRRLAEGDETQRDRIINSNLRFAFSYANKYCSFAKKGMTMEMVQYANIGLTTAVDKFDYSFGYKFITFAVHHIRQEFALAMNTEMNLVRRSNEAVIGRKVKSISQKLMQELEREPSEEEIAEAITMRYGKEVKHLCDVRDVNVSSFDKVICDDGDENVAEAGVIAMKVASHNEGEDNLAKEDLRKRIERALANLSERDSKIIRLSFGIGCDEKSNESIGEIMGMTSENVRIIINKTLPKMQKYMVGI